MRLQVVLALSVWIVGLATATWSVSRWALGRRRLASRLFSDLPEDETPDEQGWLTRRLYVAGYRGPRAAWSFVALTVLCGLAGLCLLLVIRAGTAVNDLARLLTSIPGGVGEVLLPLVYGGPWIVVALLTLIPTLVVRAARRRRIRQVELELPIVLELLATLGEAGMGLDAAIDRVLEPLPPRNVLSQELRAFQRDNLAGRPRVESLRWLGRRVSVPWFSIFVSAVVQADQIGAGLADVLKVQADDLRHRRKEQALAMASSAPIKLLVPLILCFIPGILTAAIGPSLYEILQTLDNLLLRPMR